MIIRMDYFPCSFMSSSLYEWSIFIFIFESMNFVSKESCWKRNMRLTYCNYFNLIISSLFLIFVFHIDRFLFQFLFVFWLGLFIVDFKCFFGKEKMKLKKILDLMLCKLRLYLLIFLILCVRLLLKENMEHKEGCSTYCIIISNLFFSVFFFFFYFYFFFIFYFFFFILFFIFFFKN